MRTRTNVFLDWSVPALVLVGLTVPFWTSNLDIAIAGRFHTEMSGWERGDGQPWKFLYDYGVIPAWIVSVSALAVFVASFWVGRARRHRRAAIFLVLAMIVGPGLLVNNVFKQNWGRPRPRDVVALGGDRAYVAPWVKRPRDNGNSFPSGHSATGFYLLVPYFLLRKRSRWWAVFFAALGLGYGALVGYARMLQGAHFASDVLWSLGFVYLAALALLYLLRMEGCSASLPPRIVE